MIGCWEQAAIVFGRAGRAVRAWRNTQGIKRLFLTILILPVLFGEVIFKQQPYIKQDEKSIC